MPSRSEITVLLLLFFSRSLTFLLAAKIHLVNFNVLSFAAKRSAEVRVAHQLAKFVKGYTRRA